MGPYVSQGSVSAKRLTLKWFDKGEEGGTMKVWHGNAVGDRSAMTNLGHRTNFSRNLEHMINDTITQQVRVTESSRNHTVFVFNSNEEFTYAKLQFDGNDVRQLVDDFISDYIMKEMARERARSEH